MGKRRQWSCAPARPGQLARFGWTSGNVWTLRHCVRIGVGNVGVRRQLACFQGLTFQCRITLIMVAGAVPAQAIESTRKRVFSPPLVNIATLSRKASTLPRLVCYQERTFGESYAVGVMGESNTDVPSTEGMSGGKGKLRVPSFLRKGYQVEGIRYARSRCTTAYRQCGREGKDIARIFSQGTGITENTGTKALDRGIDISRHFECVYLSVETAGGIPRDRMELRRKRRRKRV